MSEAFVFKSLRDAVRQKRIGTPLAARLMLHVTADHGQWESVLAAGLDELLGVLNAAPVELLALGGPQASQVSVLMRCRDGQSLVAAVGAPNANAPWLAATVIGNHGILSWEADDDAPTNEDHADELSASARTLLAAVRGSLERQQPVAVGASAERPVGAPLERPRVSLDVAPKPARPLAPPYGVLLVTGSHSHQEMYAPAFAKDKRCRLVGLVDASDISPRRQALNERLAKLLGIPLLPDLDAALAREDVQIVSICAEPERRAKIIVRAAKAGKHLYLDKPLAASADEGRAIVEAVASSGVTSHMFSLVHMPSSLHVRRALERQRLGELLAIHSDQLFAKGLAGSASVPQARRESAKPSHFEAIESKRELYNVGVYPLVMIGWLTGRQVRKVWATTGNYFFSEHQHADMEDFGQILLELDGGLTATISAGRSGWQSHPSAGLNRTWLIGSKASVCLDAYRPRWEVWNDEPAWTPPRRHPEDPMGFWPSTIQESGTVPKRAWITEGDELADARHFVDCLEQGKSCDVTAAHAAHVLEVLMAAYESAATGKVVTLG